MVASDAALFVFVLWPFNILPVKADDGGSNGAEDSWVAASAVPMPVSSDQQKCADRKT